MELFREIYKNEKGLLEFIGFDHKRYVADLLHIEHLFENALKEGERKHEIVHLKGLRGFGATTAVINYAKKYGYTVIVDNSRMVENLVYKFNYKDIYSVDEWNTLNIKNTKLILDFVGMECDKVFIKKYKKQIVTGFLQIENTMVNLNGAEETDDKYLGNRPIDYLEFEEKQLRKKIDKALSYDDGAMYVKLINAYEKIIDIMLKLRAAE